MGLADVAPTPPSVGVETSTTWTTAPHPRLAEDIEWAAFEGYTNRIYVGTNGSGVLQGDVGW